MKKNIIAHRGFFDNKKIIENTKEAFLEAINNNCSFELDVQLTKDNKLVVFHDDNLKRLCNINKDIKSSNYNEIKDLKLLESNSHIPLFSKVLKLNNDKVFIDIEVKPTKRVCDTIMILMNELKDYNNYSIKSFDPRIVRYIRINYPNAKVGLLVDYHYKNFTYNYLLHSKFIINYSKCQFLSISEKLLDNKKYMNIINKYPISIWTIKDINKIKIMEDYTYICNNLYSPK